MTTAAEVLTLIAELNQDGATDAVRRGKTTITAYVPVGGDDNE